MVVTAIVAAVLAIAYRLMCMWTNKRRDKAGIMEGFDHAYEDDLTDKKVRVVAPELRRLLTTLNSEYAIPLHSLNLFQGSALPCSRGLCACRILIRILYI